MAYSHEIKITDDLRNYYKLLEVPRLYQSHVNTAFVNQKKLHSINTQIVFDACYNILDIVVKWPGSTHDSQICMESDLMQLFEQMPLLLAIHVVHRNLLICNFCLKRICLGGGVHLILLMNTFLYPISFHRLCHGLVGNFLIFTSCIAQAKLLFNGLPCHLTTNHRCHRF